MAGDPLRKMNEAYCCQPPFELDGKFVPGVGKVDDHVGGDHQEPAAYHGGQEAGKDGAPPGWIHGGQNIVNKSDSSSILLLTRLGGFGGSSPRRDICSVPITNFLFGPPSSIQLSIINFHFSQTFALHSCSLPFISHDVSTLIKKIKG